MQKMTLEHAVNAVENAVRQSKFAKGDKPKSLPAAKYWFEITQSFDFQTGEYRSSVYDYKHPLENYSDKAKVISVRTTQVNGMPWILWGCPELHAPSCQSQQGTYRDYIRNMMGSLAIVATRVLEVIGPDRVLKDSLGDLYKSSLGVILECGIDKVANAMAASASLYEDAGQTCVEMCKELELAPIQEIFNLARDFVNYGCIFPRIASNNENEHDNIGLSKVPTIMAFHHFFYDVFGFGFPFGMRCCSTAGHYGHAGSAVQTVDTWVPHSINYYAAGKETQTRLVSHIFRSNMRILSDHSRRCLSSLRYSNVMLKLNETGIKNIRSLIRSNKHVVHEAAVMMASMVANFLADARKYIPKSIGKKTNLMRFAEVKAESFWYLKTNQNVLIGNRMCQLCESEGIPHNAEAFIRTRKSVKIISIDTMDAGPRLVSARTLYDAGDDHVYRRCHHHHKAPFIGKYNGKIDRNFAREWNNVRVPGTKLLTNYEVATLGRVSNLLNHIAGDYDYIPYKTKSSGYSDMLVRQCVHTVPDNIQRNVRFQSYGGRCVSEVAKEYRYRRLSYSLFSYKTDPSRMQTTLSISPDYLTSVFERGLSWCGGVTTRVISLPRKIDADVEVLDVCRIDTASEWEYRQTKEQGGRLEYFDDLIRRKKHNCINIRTVLRNPQTGFSLAFDVENHKPEISASKPVECKAIVPDNIVEQFKAIQETITMIQSVGAFSQFDPYKPYQNDIKQVPTMKYFNDNSFFDPYNDMGGCSYPFHCDHSKDIVNLTRKSISEFAKATGDRIATAYDLHLIMCHTLSPLTMNHIINMCNTMTLTQSHFINLNGDLRSYTENPNHEWQVVTTRTNDLRMNENGYATVNLAMVTTRDGERVFPIPHGSIIPVAETILNSDSPDCTHRLVACANPDGSGVKLYNIPSAEIIREAAYMRTNFGDSSLSEADEQQINSLAVAASDARMAFSTSSNLAKTLAERFQQLAINDVDFVDD